MMASGYSLDSWKEDFFRTGQSVKAVWLPPSHLGAPQGLYEPVHTKPTIGQHEQLRECVLLNCLSTEGKRGVEQEFTGLISFRCNSLAGLCLSQLGKWSIPQEDYHTNPNISLVGEHRAVVMTETSGHGAECHQCFIYMRHHLFYKLDYGFKWNTQAYLQTPREVSISISLERGRFPNQTGFDPWEEGGQANSWQCVVRRGPQD